MKRLAYNQLLSWKNDKNKKPLLLQGARQVGKTYLINEFGKNEYKNYIYLNFEQNLDIKIFFQKNLDPKIIIQNIELYTGTKINSKNTLIFFDEIQIQPKAITSLKYFQEQSPEYHIIAAGSLLGVSIRKSSSFPVGKVNFMTLYPMSFAEYLMAINETLIFEMLFQNKLEHQIPEPIHEKIITHLKIFMFLGGMPEVIKNYIKNKNISEARKIQNEILKAYQQDFSKYTDKIQSIKTSELWRSILNQLAKENKKFKYSDVKSKTRASYYEQTIEWLNNAGLINLAYNINTPKLPISAYTEYNKFKIYLLDSGLLGAMLKINSEIIIKPNTLFAEFNGAFTENFVANELKKLDETDLYYWTSKYDAEVDFILQSNNKIYPIEVKSGMSKNKKSLKSYADKYNPEKLLRISPRNFTIDNNFTNIPLYAVCQIYKHL
ncbi:MAG: ATP-binding protein [Bacteroidales bacterium]|nr:ATP-binding protein [Bacteroidales bacterium]